VANLARGMVLSGLDQLWVADISNMTRASLCRIEQARCSLRAGRGIRLEELETE
jgi:hypothetical protein